MNIKGSHWEPFSIPSSAITQLYDCPFFLALLADSAAAFDMRTASAAASAARFVASAASADALTEDSSA
jgi:hypothetical protein